MPRLKMLRGPDVGTVYELDKAVMSIGRGQKNTIIIQDNEVSRNHCRLVRVLDDYEIHDLQSTNGTFVNGQRVDEGGWLLSGQCIVEIGDSITLEYTPTDVALGTSPPLAPPAEMRERVFYLVIEQQTLDQPEIYVLDRPILNIGRDVDNEITLQEKEVSRHHMRLVLAEDGYTIEDLNTVNGTSLNGVPLQRQSTLSNEDVITVGKGLKMWYTDNPTKLLEDGTSDNNDMDTTFGKAVDDNADDALLKETDLKIQIGHGLKHGDLENSLFLLYAREEWGVIGRHLHTFLSDNNVDIFSEQYLTPDTDNWRDAMEQALAESPCMLAVISDKSIAVPHVGRYIRYFLTRDKAVLLLRYGKISRMPMVLQKMPAIRFDPKNPEKSFRMILAELRRVGL